MRDVELNFEILYSDKKRGTEVPHMGKVLHGDFEKTASM